VGKPNIFCAPPTEKSPTPSKRNLGEGGKTNLEDGGRKNLEGGGRTNLRDGERRNCSPLLSRAPLFSLLTLYPLLSRINLPFSRAVFDKHGQCGNCVKKN